MIMWWHWEAKEAEKKMIKLRWVKNGTNNVVEERVCSLRRQRVDEVQQFTQQKDEFILLVAVSQFLEEHSEEQRRFLDQAVPDHLLSYRTHFTHTNTHAHTHTHTHQDAPSLFLSFWHCWLGDRKAMSVCKRSCSSSRQGFALINTIFPVCRPDRLPPLPKVVFLAKQSIRHDQTEWMNKILMMMIMKMIRQKKIKMIMATITMMY